MEITSAGDQYEIGMIGLGVMGRNLSLNMADHGYAVAGYDLDPARGEAFNAAAADGVKVRAAGTLEEFVRLLRVPRAVMLLVPPGPPVDAVIQALLPYLQRGDLIIDSGNSHFTDTEVRMKSLEAQGIGFLGVGLSGGEYGARHGPSLMPGGPRGDYERVRPIFEAVAARVDGLPCVTYIGPGASGHYVKMVHNGIEYGWMQLLAESYDLLKRGLNLTNDELNAIYRQWDRTELESYLLEITAGIFLQDDATTGKRLIDLIRGSARQLGTGRWAVQDAMDLQVPIPTIAAAVAMRDLSQAEAERTAASKTLTGPSPAFQGERDPFVEQLRGAMRAAEVLVYSEGMALLHRASQARKYGLNLAELARIWRGGCIIRAALLKQIQAAYQAHPDLASPMLDPDVGREVIARQGDLRAITCTAAGWGLPVPAMMASLAYFDSYRSSWLPANLIQAQRDYFGAHRYERLDTAGLFHTRWVEAEE